MKKFLALVLALCLVASLGAVAFAAPSVQKKEVSEDVTTALPAVPAGGLDVCLFADDSVDHTIPEEAVSLVSLADADSLEAADKEAFLAAFEDAKEIKDQVVKYFFWLSADGENAEIAEGQYAAFKFFSKGENVKVLLNGEEVEVVALEEENGYLAKLPGFGAIAILCDAE